MKKLKITFLAVLGLTLFLGVSFYGINQFDEPLSPESERILSEKAPFTESDQKIYDLMLKQEKCQTTDLANDPVAQAYIEAGHFHYPEDRPIELSKRLCLIQKFTMIRDTLPEIKNLWILKRDEGKVRIQKYLQLWTTESLENQLALGRLLALVRLREGLENLKAWTNGDEKLFHSLLPERLGELLAKDSKTFAKEVHDSELRAFRSFTVPEAYHANPDESFDSWTGRLFIHTLQPNRTMNKMLAEWDKAIECGEKAGAPCETISKLKPLDYIINPYGNYMVMIFLPKFATLLPERYEKKLSEVRNLVSQR